MVLNSTTIIGTPDSSNPRLIINTSDFNSEDLSNFITLSEEIERSERLRRSNKQRSPAMLPAKMTREEIFECSTLDDDHFLTALEHQSTYASNPSTQVTDLDLSQSMEDILKYFDEDVKVDYKSISATPVRLSPDALLTKGGRVANAVAHLRSKLTSPASTLSPKKMSARKNQPEVRADIKALRAKYESNGQDPALRNPLPMNLSQTRPRSPKINKKSKVKQMAQLFNNKINQLLGDGKQRYASLQNEFSPEPLPVPAPRFINKSWSGPVAKPRTTYPIYRRSPVASPRIKRKVLPTSTCLVAEEVFSQLSVRDKAVLYQKFIEEMSSKNPKFTKHAERIEAHVQKEMARGEVVSEKQDSVKNLAKELEAKLNITKPKISPLALQRMQSIEAAAKTTSEEQDDESDESLHISTLTVILKPSPEKKRRAPQPPRPMPRRKRDARFLQNMLPDETAHKRNNDAMRSSIPIEAYAPPKKIRRTRAERLAPKRFFENQQLERLFYRWLKEKNGVSFDITSVVNKDETICIIPEPGTESKNNSLENDTQKSSVDRLLEEAIAKLENVELSSKSQEEVTASCETLIMAEEQKVVEIELPIEEPDVPPIPPPRKSKLPVQISAADSTIPNTSCTNSVKPSETEESESGLSSVPKPPENELQKSHDHNPAALSEHQLRVQASLQRLNIPDWFRQYNQANARSPECGGTAGAGGTLSTYKPGNFTRKRTTDSGRWAGLNSKTTSLSSLGSQRSDRSPLLLSPSAHSHHGGQTAGGAAAHQQHHGATNYGGGNTAFSRWSTSHLNSSQTSPSVSQRGSFSRGGPVNSSFMSVASGNSSVIRSSFRQPYLGWRSQEKLSQRTPHERLASSLLAQQQRTSPTQRNGGNGLQPVTPEIQTSIKEVTSAIVHYVNDQTNQQNSRSTSPNSRKCWLESSFVGIRPLDSPQTPIIDNTATFSTAAAAALTSNNYNHNNNNVSLTTAYNPASALHPAALTSGFGYAHPNAATSTHADVLLRMNGLSLSAGGAPERSLSNASLEDVLASLLGLPSSSHAAAGVAPSASDAYDRSTTGDSVSKQLGNISHMPQQNSQFTQQQQQQQQQQLLLNLQAEQQRLRRRSEGDAPTPKTPKDPLQPQLPTECHNNRSNASAPTTTANAASTSAAAATAGSTAYDGTLCTRRVSLGDSSESNNKTTSELQIKCRNTKCDRSATPAEAKKYYKSCHNCTHLYCTRECRRAHWEKHRKACLHSRASNLCRQVLATCKDDLDSQRHLSLLARKGFLSQGRGVVRVLFRSAEAAEGFIKHGFQCMGEASYVRWPDLMPAEMGLELYSELLKLSTEYKPDSKMLIYVAICVVSEAPGMGQAPVRWERQLVSRCAKLKLCKTILVELEQQQQALQQPLAMVAVPEPTTEILILTFNPSLRTTAAQREVILTNILDILSRRGVVLRKHYPEIYQRLQTYTEGQTDKFNPVTLHPRDSQTGQGFVCIIMPVHTDSEIIRLPSAADGGNRVTTIDVGSPAALAEFDDDELLTRSTS